MSTPRLDDLLGPNGETREWLILASIRAGGYPHVAAAAYSVRAELFMYWLHRGRSKKAPRRCRRLSRLVHEAAARARLKAEMAVHEADARFWLRYGPCKETLHAPGWTAAAKPISEAGSGGLATGLHSPEFQAILARITNVLAAFPEARAAVAEALAG
jgi:hypothetical protein